MEKYNMARFNARLPEAQKELFERAASLGGFRNLTEFILHAAQQAASHIISDHEQFLQSERDRELFFETLMDPPEPNENLKKAKKRYDDWVRQ